MALSKASVALSRVRRGVVSSNGDQCPQTLKSRGGDSRPPLSRARLHSGWLHGERLRDGETGWFPESFAHSITSRVAVEGNVRRMERLRVETDV